MFSFCKKLIAHFGVLVSLFVKMSLSVKLFLWKCEKIKMTCFPTCKSTANTWNPTHNKLFRRRLLRKPGASNKKSNWKSWVSWRRGRWKATLVACILVIYVHTLSTEMTELRISSSGDLTVYVQFLSFYCFTGQGTSADIPEMRWRTNPCHSELPIKLEFGSVGCCVGRKTLKQGQEPTKKLSLHMTPGPGIEPRHYHHGIPAPLNAPLFIRVLQYVTIMKHNVLSSN